MPTEPTFSPNRHDRPFAGAAAIAAVALSFGPEPAAATEPCGDFGECKALIEINSSDGDIGFHFLIDGDDLNAVELEDPNGAKVFQDQAKGPLMEQKLTETFTESAEPLCWFGDPDETVVTLMEFLDRWAAGTYSYWGKADNGERLNGVTELTYLLPAAPLDVDFDGSVISWEAGDDLGQCASNAELDDLVGDGVLPLHPENVPVDAWEIVLVPDVDDGDPIGALPFTIRVPGSIATKEVTVPPEYLTSLPFDTPVKIEVGAIGGEDNATFTEEDGFCVNVADGCD